MRRPGAAVVHQRWVGEDDDGWGIQVFFWCFGTVMNALLFVGWQGVGSAAQRKKKGDRGPQHSVQ